MDTRKANLSDIERQIKKRLHICVAVCCAIIFGVLCFVLSPLLTAAYTNYLLSGIWIYLLEIVIELFNIAAYAVSFSAIIYSVYKFGAKGSISVISVYLSAVFVKYIANIIVTLLTYKVISPNDFFVVLFYFAMDALTALVIVLIIKSVFKKFYKNFYSTEKANALLTKKVSSARDKLLPFKKLYDPSNALQRSALYVGGVLAIIKIFTRIWSDIGYGAPVSLFDLFVMIVYYLSDILICVVVYLLSLLTVSYFDKKEITLKDQ